MDFAPVNVNSVEQKPRGQQHPFLPQESHQPAVVIPAGQLREINAASSAVEAVSKSESEKRLESFCEHRVIADNMPFAVKASNQLTISVLVKEVDVRLIRRLPVTTRKPEGSIIANCDLDVIRRSKCFSLNRYEQMRCQNDLGQHALVLLRRTLRSYRLPSLSRHHLPVGNDSFGPRVCCHSTDDSFSNERAVLYICGAVKSYIPRWSLRSVPSKNGCSTFQPASGET